MSRQLVQYPSDLLIAHNRPIESYTLEVAARVKEMFAVLRKVEGSSLAAPQVGWSARLFIIGVPGPNDGEAVERVVWNPTIETSGELAVMPEGCLSFPNVTGKVARWTRARLRGMTPEGPLDEVFYGMAAQTVQHEMDHLEGSLFIEKMSPADMQRNGPELHALAARERARL